MSKLTINAVSYDQELDMISVDLHVDEKHAANMHIDFASHRSTVTFLMHDVEAIRQLPVANTVILTALVINELAEACDEETMITLCPEITEPLEIDLSAY